MRLSKWLPILVIVVLALAASTVLADSRINQVHHFGGDVLYCTQEDGCWMVNMTGEPLWEVPQADIEAAVDAACETGTEQVIEAGDGTYGPAYLVLGCPDYMNLVGWDEWGKQNTMTFTTAYLPVNPAPSQELRCSVDLYSFKAISFDGKHKGGYDIWESNADLELLEFLYWSESDGGYPACDIEIRRS